MKDRIRQLMDYEGLNAAQFSKKVNINTSVLSHLLGGRNLPSYDIVQKIVAACPDMNIEWFITGRGPMIKPTSDALADEWPADSPVDDYPQLFETPKSVPVHDPAVKYRKENGVQQPEKAPEKPVVQADMTLKNAPREVRKIVVFYEDNTYEEFFPDGRRP